jgi:hypothetical protein
MNAPAPPPKQAEALRGLAWSDTDVSLERAYEQMMKARPTPNVTIEAVRQAVRDRGVSALDEKQTRERLQQCDPAAIAEIDHWLLKRGIS